jgi:hypothetical protein
MTPLRFTILQLAQIFLTDALTFMRLTYNLQPSTYNKDSFFSRFVVSRELFVVS